MEYEVTLKIYVDSDASYLEVSGNNCETVEEEIKSALYDLDDITVLDIDTIMKG
jgi:hypothetical protein|tara:strand:+ start:271 stop:432 length:162 start_codon:yes stop_codon:yes gene_type:complete